MYKNKLKEIVKLMYAKTRNCNLTDSEIEEYIDDIIIYWSKNINIQCRLCVLSCCYCIEYKKVGFNKEEYKENIYKDIYNLFKKDCIYLVDRESQ